MDLEDLLARVCSADSTGFPGGHVSLLLREDDDLVLRAHHGTLTPVPGRRTSFRDVRPLGPRVLATGGTLIEKICGTIPEYVGFHRKPPPACAFR